jgi:Protein of unknown function (DUF2652)
VFAFKAEGEPGIRGQSVIDCLTACYEAFGGRLDAAGELMTCTCDACLSIGGLDLKFVLHTASTSSSRSQAARSFSALT